MPQDKSRRPRFQFSLRCLIFATTCFAVALWWFVTMTDSSLADDLKAVTFFLPVFGAGIGGGIGVLIGRFWSGVIIGALVHYVLFFALAMVAAMRYRS